MPNDILHILQQQLIPWSETDGMERVLVARARLSEMEPNQKPGFSFTPQKLTGTRKGVRSFTFNRVSARWPAERLLETPWPLLSFVLSGQADLRIGDYWTHTNEGQGIFVLGNVPRPDGTLSQVHPRNQKYGECSLINFGEARGRLQIWVNYSHGKKHKVAEPDEYLFTLDGRGVQLLNQMQFYFTNGSSNTDSLCGHLLNAFLKTIEFDLQNNRFVRPGLLHNTQRMVFDGYDPIKQAQEYVQTHLHEPLTIEGTAREVHLSRTQFALRFRRETGQTFNEFVTSCRVEQAKVLLHETDYTLTFISKSIGYRSLTYFHKVFSKSCGVSPQEFRQTKKTS